MAVSVSTFSELKTAIEDSTTTDISVTNDLTFSGGIKVNVSKSSTTINFNGHTITDNNSSSFTDTIYVASTTNKISVIVKNAVWSGRNYYGVIGVYDGNSNTTIELDNINYTGPQFVYNKNGSTYISNCTILIDKNNSSYNSQEFCEASKLYISGNVSVTSNTSSNAVIWFTGTGALLSVLENATFTVNAPLTYFLYTDVSPNMTFKQNSTTKITTKSGLFYNSSSSSHIANTFLLEENATFISSKTTSNSVPLFKCLTTFTIGNNSTFQLFSEQSSSTALVYFGQTANINISNPKSVLLYNNGGNVFNFQTGSTSSPNILNINSEMLRFWNKASTPLSSAGGFNDSPTTQYFKNNYLSNINIQTKVSSSKVLSIENNLEDGDSGYPISIDNFNILSSQVISMGSLTININQITDISKNIQGTTDPISNVLAQYNEITLEGSANESGLFSLPLSEIIPISTTVSISTNKNFLVKKITTVSEGSISITSLLPLNFFTFTTETKSNIIFRQNDNWEIQITDTRLTGNQWYLYAYIVEPLTSNENTLDNALIFTKDGVTYTLSSTPILVYSGKWEKDSNITTINWEKIEGFLLNIDIEKTYIAGNYSTNIFWEITTDLI